jgi:DNA-binding winged helix-turn-helix (wHTH) protein/tetratricopeptide (TPR) repeat protein
VRVAFADCELDVGRHELRRAGQVVALEPQVFDVLAYLARNGDRLVTKNELLDEIWGDRFVSESALTSRIKSARRAVGDTGRDQRIIRTIHGRGYRFVATVEDAGTKQISTESSGVAGPSAQDTAPVRTVLAVARDAASDAGRAIDDQAAGLVDALGSGRGVPLDIEGPHASRKTALIDQAVDLATASGYLVGTGSAAGGGSRTFGCVLDAVDELVQREATLVDHLPLGARAELERCLAGGSPTTRQRLFVAVRELVVQAAAHRPTLIALDDLELATDETLALIRHIGRLAHRHRLALLCAHRPGVVLGSDFRRLTLEAPAAAGATSGLHTAPAEVREALARVAPGGPSFDLLEFRATSGVDAARGDRMLDIALASGVIVPVAHGGFRFADPDDAARLAGSLAPHRRSEVHRSAARELGVLGAPPDRVATHLLAAGETEAAVRPGLEAARQAAAAQLHHEVLRWTASLVDQAPRPERVELLRLRGDALVASGDPTAVPAYRMALSLAAPDQVASLRARLARAAMVSGDLATATEALDGLTPDGGPDDGEILVALGMHAYFTGDIATAQQTVEDAREMALAPDAPNVLFDIITLEGMIAHNRGEWFDRLLRELRATRKSPALASKIFDSHICVAEYLLYGPTPYTEVVTLAHELRANAERAGARRAVAFAACVAGEAELLGGEVDAARRDLLDAVALHRELGAETGTAHSLQRLAEAELAAGNRAEAERTAREALLLARWSPLARHILQRTYGTLISAAPDAESALAVVDDASETLDEPGSCLFCQVMVAVPSAVACAEGGRPDEARHHLAVAEMSASLWEGTAWEGSVTEAKACLARVEGDQAETDRLLARAARLFDDAGQTLDAARCREAIGS